MHFWDWFEGDPHAADLLLWATCCVVGLLFYLLNSTGAEDPPKHKGKGESAEEIQRATYEALEHETRANWSFCQHLWNRPWSGTPLGRDKVPAYGSTEAWLKGRPFPNGEQRLHELWPSTIAVWKFYYSRTKPHLSAVQAFLAGMCPHFISLLIDRTIKEISANDMDAAVWKLPLYGLGIVSVKLISLVLGYESFRKFPGSSLEHELRVRLHREFIEMDEQQREKWPPGKMVTLLDIGVSKFISNVWHLLYTLLRLAGSVVAVPVLIPCIVPCDPMGAFLHTSMVLYIAAPSFLTLATRGRAGHDLAIRARDWKLAWTSLFGSHLTKGGDPQQLNAELCATAWVYRKRGFHLKMKAIAGDDMMQIFTTTMYTFLAFYWAFSVRIGRLELSTAVSVLTIVWNLGNEGSTALMNYEGFLEGHSYLLPIADVLNHEEFSEALLETDESDSSELVSGRPL